MTKKSPTELGQNAWRAFHNIRITLLPPLVKHLNDKCGLSEAEYQVFVGLQASKNKKMKPSELADELGWDLGRLSHQVSRMESKGFVGKEPCPEDARSCLIGATRKGQSIFEKALPIQTREVKRLFVDALTKEQLRSIIEISEAIESHIEKLEKS